MRIDGLTQEQCNMLDEMWKRDSTDELFAFFATLPKKKFEMAMVLHNMMLQELCEDMVKVEDGKQLLKNIGVNVA